MAPRGGHPYFGRLAPLLLLCMESGTLGATDRVLLTGDCESGDREAATQRGWVGRPRCA